MCHTFDHPKSGFTIIEVVATLVLLGVMAIFLTPVLTNVVRGYVMTRSTDAITQKAQIALQRMTIELSYATVLSKPSDKHSIIYTSSFYNNTNDIENHTVLQYGENVFYYNGSNMYLFIDSVADNGLIFNCYENYDSSAPVDCGNTNVNIVDISLSMHGPDWATGVTKTFSTRVMVNKLSQ